MPAALQNIDETILFFIQNHLKNPVLDRVMVFFSSIGNAGFLWLLIAIILLLQKRYQKCGITLIIALTLASFLGNEVFKPLFGRVRPCNKFPEVELLINRLHTASFPSGHTMAAFTSATVLYCYQRRYGLLAFAVAGMIAFSRLYLFVHYPSDVLGGIIFGVVNALIIVYGTKKIYWNLENKHSELP